MAMPEAAVYEHSRPEAWEHNVRSARKACTPQAISEASGVQRPTDHLLQLGIGAADTGHHPASRFLIHDIGHAADDRRRLLQVRRESIHAAHSRQGLSGSTPSAGAP